MDSAGSGGAAEPCFEPLFPVVSGSNHCPEGCPGSFRVAFARRHGKHVVPLRRPGPVSVLVPPSGYLVASCDGPVALP